jgi:hypothetical protein
LQLDSHFKKNERTDGPSVNVVPGTSNYNDPKGQIEITFSKRVNSVTEILNESGGDEKSSSDKRSKSVA